MFSLDYVKHQLSSRLTTARFTTYTIGNNNVMKKYPVQKWFIANVHAYANNDAKPHALKIAECLMLRSLLP